MADIYTAIAEVLQDVGVVGKDATNTFDRYKYRSIDAVMNAMHPAMAKHGVFVTPEVLEVTQDERNSKDGKAMIYSVAKVKYTFYTKDGSSVSATVCGEGMDRGDKSLNKAMSAAFKYALFQTFCIPTEEMVDSETESPEISGAITKKESQVLRSIMTENQIAQAEKHYGKKIEELTKKEYAELNDVLREAKERNESKGNGQS